jgi:hypothetical protein
MMSIRLEDLTGDLDEEEDEEEEGEDEDEDEDWEAGSKASTIGASRIDRAVLRALGGGGSSGSRGGKGGKGGSSGGKGGGRSALATELSPSPLLLRAAREARAQLRSPGGARRAPLADECSERSEEYTPSETSRSYFRAPGSITGRSRSGGSLRSSTSSRPGSSVSLAEASAQQRRARLEELLELKATGLVSNEVFLAKQRDILRAL